jgi:hypothetical protein
MKRSAYLSVAVLVAGALGVTAGAGDAAESIEAGGTFSFTHQIDGRGRVYRAYAKVDCLITGGHVATVTGVVTKADAPDFRGKRVGITVEDNGRKGDRLGFSWGVAPDPPQRCLGTAPFTVVKAGNLRVHDALFTIPGDD